MINERAFIKLYVFNMFKYGAFYQKGDPYTFFVKKNLQKERDNWVWSSFYFQPNLKWFENWRKLVGKKVVSNLYRRWKKCLMYMYLCSDKDKLYKKTRSFKKNQSLYKSNFFAEALGRFLTILWKVPPLSQKKSTLQKYNSPLHTKKSF